jgi:hypothetical protein
MDINEVTTMELAEAITGALKGRHKEVCKELGIGYSIGYEWRNRNSEKRSPFRTIEQMVKLCIKHGATREEALAPLLWVNKQVGLVSFPAPDINSGSDKVFRSFAKTAKELGDIAAELERAQAPDSRGGKKITPFEASSAMNQIDELMRAAAELKIIIMQEAERV